MLNAAVATPAPAPLEHRFARPEAVRVFESETTFHPASDLKSSASTKVGPANTEARLDASATSTMQMVFTEVTLADHRRDDFSRFEAAIRGVDEIVECHLVSGGYDYLLKFITQGVSNYQEIIEGLLERNIGIDKYFSYIVIKSPFIKNYYPIERLFGCQKDE